MPPRWTTLDTRAPLASLAAALRLGEPGGLPASHLAERALALAVDADLLSADERAAIDATVEAVERAISGSERHAIQGAAEELEHRTKIFAERRMDRGIRKALAGRNVAEIGG